MNEREAIKYLVLKRAQLERRYGPRRAGDTNLYIHALDVAIGALAASVMILEGGKEDEREDHQVGCRGLEKVRL